MSNNTTRIRKKSDGRALQDLTSEFVETLKTKVQLLPEILLQSAWCSYYYLVNFEMADWIDERLRRKEEDESIIALLDRRNPDFAAALAKAFSQQQCNGTLVQQEHQVKSFERIEKRPLPEVPFSLQSKRPFLQKSSSSQSHSRLPPLFASQSHRQGIQSQSSSQSQTQREAKSRAYVQWDKQMDIELANVLCDQMNIGNKVDGDWKPQAYQEAKDHLNATLGLSLTRENVKNRLKSWKMHYAVISDIINQSGGFAWDDESQILQAVHRLMLGSNREFKLLKSLPDDKKKKWIEVLLGHPST